MAIGRSGLHIASNPDTFWRRASYVWMATFGVLQSDFYGDTMPDGHETSLNPHTSANSHGVGQHICDCVRGC